MIHSGFHQTDSVSSLAMGTLASIAKGANATISIRSNTSPEISINIADLLSGGDTTGASSVSSSNQASLQWIKPQIIIRNMGNDTVFTPYGEPNSLGFIGLTVSIILMGLLGAKIALVLCRSVRKH